MIRIQKTYMLNNILHSLFLLSSL